MKLRHLPPVLFLFVTALSLPPPPLSYHRHISLPRTQPSSSSQHHAAAADALLRRLAAVEAGADYLLAEAAELLANASLSSTPSPGNAHHHHRLPYHSSNATASSPPSAYRLRVPHDTTLHADDSSRLAAFRASLRSFLLARRHIHTRRDDNATAAVAGVMRDLPGLLGLRGRFPTCAVVGNSGILLSSGRGPQIDAHDFVIRLINAPAAGGFARDVGAKTSLSLAHSTVLRRCAAASPGGGCAACHPYGRGVPLAMYVSHADHLLDVLVCNATAAPAASPPPFRLVLTDARLDALCSRIAKCYSLRRFVSATGEPASGWARRRRDERPPHFHYSSGLQAVVVALGVCDEVSMFGFGKAAGARHHYHTGRKETDVHDYEAEYQFYRDLQTRPEAVPFLDQAPAGFRLPPVRQYW